jgi:hypothetical protein
MTLRVSPAPVTIPVIPAPVVPAVPGTLANIPTATVDNAGTFYLATDEEDGTLYLSTGSTWVPTAPGVNVPGGNQLAHAQITASQAMTVTPADTPVAIVGLSPSPLVFTAATMVRVKLTGYGLNATAGSAVVRIKVWDGTVGVGTLLLEKAVQTSMVNMVPDFGFETWPTLGVGSHSLNCSFETNTNTEPVGFQLFASEAAPFSLGVAKA